MKLLKRNKREIVGVQRGLKRLTIFLDGFAGVPFRKAKIENALVGNGHAGAADAGAEAVYEPRDFLETAEL
jgi:hypothetical protein